MSKNRRNNHYHYAEKFDSKRNHSRSGRAVFVPFKAVIASLIVLMMFGLVSTTFGAYMTETTPDENPDKPGIISEVRNTKASRDVVVTGAKADIAETGAEGWMTMNGGGYFIFDNTNSNWSDVQMLVGRRYTYGNDGVFCRKYNMSRISNTNLYALQISNWSTSGDGTHIYDIVFVTGASGWQSDENTSPVDRRTYASHWSAVYNSSGASFVSTGVYACSVSSGSNNGTVSISVITSNGYGYYNYDQTIRSYTKNANTSGSYNQINDGGTITGSGVKLNGNSSSTSSSEADGKVVCAKTSTVTLTATVNTGYRFVGWYNSSNTQITSATSGYTLGTDSNGKPTLSYTVTGAREIRARFIKTYTVTIAKSPSGYTGTAPTVNGSTTSATVDIGSSVTLAHNAPTGVSAVWRSGSISGSTVTSPYTPTDDVTLYACYTLTAPTIDTFSYSSSGVTTEGSTTSLTPSVTATSAAGANGSLSYTYTVQTKPTGVTTSDYTFNSSTGAFKANVAGTYTIRVKVTDTAYGLSANKSSAASGTPRDVTILVKPVTPVRSDFKYTVLGYTDDYTAGTTGEDHSLPIKVPINSENFKITAWLDTTNANYTYKWINDGGNYNTTTGAVTPISGLRKTGSTYRIEDLCTDTGTGLKVNADGHYAYVMNVYSTRNNVDSEPLTVTLYYDVISDFLDIQWMSFTEGTDEYQKIYAEDNGITQIRASIRAGGTTFNTISWFSKNNINYTTVELWGNVFPFTNSFGTFTAPKPDDSAHRTAAKQESFNVENIMQYLGTKWIRIYMNDTGNQKTASATRTIHTTVGTASTVSDRPIYYIDNAGNTFVGSRVMAFYLVSSDATPKVHFQTAQMLKDDNGAVISGREKTYRFYIPSDATDITFAHVSTNNYILPTLSNGDLSYSLYTNHEVLMAWTNTIDLTDPDNAGMTTFIADTRGTADANGIYNYTNTGNGGNMTTLPDPSVSP